MTCRLAQVVIATQNPGKHLAVYEAFSGQTARKGDDATSFVFTFGDATILLDGAAPSAPNDTGIQRLTIAVSDFEATTARLVESRAPIQTDDGSITVDREWAGVRIELQRHANKPSGEAAVAAVLDHVAIIVNDMDAAVARWHLILGAPPVMFGVHPLGTAIVARFHLGERMIELATPLPDQDPANSMLRARLDRVGEGVLALAVVANDIDATKRAVEAAGGRIIHQPPHDLVHPADAAGVLIQLTLRVHH